ncbi:MAG: prefoldin subunit [Candidatus Thorarchaeota archaeon]
MAQKLPPALEDKIRNYENQRRIYESFKSQNLVTQQELSEIRLTLEELRKYPDDAVTYKAVGTVMFRVDKAQLITDFDDRLSTLERRLESTGRKTSELETKLTTMKNEIQIELGKLNLTLQ